MVERGRAGTPIARRRTLRPSMAAAVRPLGIAAVLALAVTACGASDDGARATEPTSADATDATDTTAPGTFVPDTSALDTLPPDSTAGTGEQLTITYRLVGAEGADAGEQVLGRLRARADAMGLDATLSVAAGLVQIVVQGVTADVSEAVVRGLGSVGAPLLLRPVLGCAVVAADPSGPAVDTTVVDGSSHAAGPATLKVLGSEPPMYCSVGPAQGTGAVFEPSAEAQQIPGASWGVVADLRPGADGEDVWNALAAQCFQASATCPSMQLGIELDGQLVTVATVQTAEFEGSVQISGSFTELDARALADTITNGASPFILTLSSTTTG